VVDRLDLSWFVQIDVPRSRSNGGGEPCGADCLLLLELLLGLLLLPWLKITFVFGW
jgi:hypothetical protein